MTIKQCAAALLVCFAISSNPAQAAIDQTKLPEVSALQYHQSTLISAGLPQPDDIGHLAEAGVQVVINLIPADADNQLSNENSLVTSAGMIYHQIDVDWNTPSLANYQQFEQLMQRYSEKSVLVHCQANYRASAFVYLHQYSLGNDDLSIMSPWGDLQESLNKYPQWAELIEQVKKP